MKLATVSDEELFQDTSKHPRKKRKLSAPEEKSERVEKISASLRSKHADRFTTIQLRLWAEMVDVGTHRFVKKFDFMLYITLHVCSTYTLFQI